MFNHTSPPEFYSKKESEMKKYTIGLITGALLAVSAMMFMGAQYTTYDIDDVYRKVKNIEYDVSNIKSDVSWMKLYGVECDD